MTVINNPRSVLDALPCTLPTEYIPDDVDPAAVGNLFAEKLPTGSLDAQEFVSHAIWRDSFALTSSLRTFYSGTTIAATWNKLNKVRKTTAFEVKAASATVRRIHNEICWVELPFTFETSDSPATFCHGVLSLVPGPGATWKIWVVRTILDQIVGYNNVDILEPVAEETAPNGVHSANGEHHGPQHYDCVVVGAGQGGLGVAGRLKALGVSYVLIDRNQEVGDNWMLRYDTARLHTTREYAHLPYDRTFNPEYQEYLTKYDLARGYKTWVAKFGINTMLSTTLKSGTWDQANQLWNLKLQKTAPDLDTEFTLTCAHVIMAVGAGGQRPLMPVYPNQAAYKGLILHSVNYKNPSEWKGKHGVIIGTANTGHDVAEDMVDAGLEKVTMVQRGRTYVMPQSEYKKTADVYYNAKLPTHIADRLHFSNPLVLSSRLAKRASRAFALQQPEIFDGLEKAGFRVERDGDILYYINVRLGGHYMDVGASQRIIDGQIKMKSDAIPMAYYEDGLEFSDGSRLKADVIVFATGFAGNVRDDVRQIFGNEVADNVDDFWTLDHEGELKGAFRPTGHPRLWYIGGTIGHARYYSRFVGLQIKAALMGTPLPVYEEKDSELSALKVVNGFHKPRES